MNRLSLIWKLLRHPLVWISLVVHGVLLTSPMPDLSPLSPLAEEGVAEEPEEEEVSVDILSFSQASTEPQQPQQPQNQQESPPPQSSQPPPPTEESLELQEELAEEIENITQEEENNPEDADLESQEDPIGGTQLPFNFGGNCDEVSGNFDNTFTWPRLFLDELMGFPRDQLELFFTVESIDNETYEAVSDIDCLKLIGRNEEIFVSEVLQDNADRAGLVIGPPELYGEQTLHTLIQPDGTPAARITTIPFPPAKVLVLTWRIDPRTR